jgi:hypothetical protein
MIITEHQQGMNSWSSNYAYVGPDKASGLHRFTENGKTELFAKRLSPPAGWYLQRGAWTFEFVRGAS